MDDMRKRRMNKKQKNILIGFLLAIVLVMAVGYAAFSTQLNISNTAQIDSKWDVEITNIIADKTASCSDSEDITTCSTTGNVAASYNNTNGLSATFQAALISPGDSVKYTVEVSNKGTLDAVINSLTLSTGNNPAIEVTTTPATLSNQSAIRLPKRTGNEDGKANLYITVKYKDTVEEQPALTTTSITVTLGAVQDNGSYDYYIEPASAAATLVKLGLTGEDVSKGLYEDTTENNRYIYRGSSPQNYFTFSGQTWRIISVESDGTIKIIKQANLSNNMAWDAKYTRSQSANTYCQRITDYGCHVWAATSNMVDTPQTVTLYYPNGGQDTATETYTGTVTQDASLNTFLNGEYYINQDGNINYLNSEKSNIVEHEFYIGTPGNSQDEESIATDYEQEKRYVWKGKVGLIQNTDFLKASTDVTCTSLKAAYSNSSNCGTTNWLNSNSGYYWTISPCMTTARGSVWIVSTYGNTTYTNANRTGYYARPVVYLSSDIKIEGNGTSGNAYHIVP